MLSFLASLIPQLKATPVGATLLIPLNLSHVLPGEQDDTHATEAEAVVLGAQRRTAAPGRWSFAVVAGGRALQYHASSVNELTASFEHHAAIILENVPEQRLGDSSFWYLLFRAQLQPAGHTGKTPRMAPETQYDEVKEAAKEAAKAAAHAAEKAAKSAASYLKHEMKVAAHHLKE